MTFEENGCVSNDTYQSWDRWVGERFGSLFKQAITIIVQLAIGTGQVRPTLNPLIFALIKYNGMFTNTLSLLYYLSPFLSVKVKYDIRVF